MTTTTQEKKSIPNLIALAFIRFYQLAISPFFPGCCRFEPTCSQYGREAFQKYGFWKALKLTLKRLIKCHPGGPHGYDPVP
jgi:putative membrane protein insertion efficiency factor